MHDSLERELGQAIEECSALAKRNYVYAHLVFIVSVVGSFGATVLVASGLEYKLAAAIMAALPGLALLVNNTLRFEERTRWFWRKARMAEGYHRAIRDAGDPQAGPLSRQYSEVCRQLEAEWPAFGSVPGQPTKPGA